MNVSTNVAVREETERISARVREQASKKKRAGEQASKRKWEQTI